MNRKGIGKHLLSRLIFFLTIFLCISQFLIGDIQNGDIQTVDIQKLGVKDCLLPEDHPLQNKLKKLFDNPSIFELPEHLRLAGFTICNRIRRGLMVISHPNIKNYLIKKFQNETPRKAQLRNYLRRINGARTLRQFIQLNNLQHIVVPKKWLYLLPESFSDPETQERTYILIVERMDICSGGKDVNGEVAKRYYNIDTDVLRELCVVVYYFRGLDSGLQNMPFTYQNKIAFIDTEHWKNDRRKEFLRFALLYMPQDRQEYALTVFQDLLEQDKR